jgi:hypothetical protein
VQTLPKGDDRLRISAQHTVSKREMPQRPCDQPSWKGEKALFEDEVDP